MSERLYSIEIPLQREDSNYLNKVIKRNTEVDQYCLSDKFHLTISESFYCSDRNVRLDLENWLKTQDPFYFKLDEVSHFMQKGRGLIYLTSTDKKQRESVENLHYEIYELIKPVDLDKQNNYRYIPHVTLMKGIPKDKLLITKEKLRGANQHPIVMEISGIKIRARGNNGWYDARYFGLGKDPINEDDFLQTRVGLAY